MRVLVAYDGSSGSEAVLEHLRRRRAGLLPVVDALILAVEATAVRACEVVPETLGLPPSAARVAALEAVARGDMAGSIRRLRRAVRAAAGGLQAALPSWTVRSRVVIGFPAQEILAQAAAWKADLIVLGSRGRSWWQRWILGSVAREVANKAGCAVRIVRGRLGTDGSAVGIVIGIDGSPAAPAAVQAVAGRLWPAGSAVRLVMAIDARLSAALSTLQTPGEHLTDEYPAQRHPLLTGAQRAADLLKAAGLHAQLVMTEGDPKHVLVQEAKRADCLFVGARGLTGFARFMLGSVSSTVAAKARCTVEVIRPAPLPVDQGPAAGERAQRPGGREAPPVAGDGRWAMSGNRLKQFLDDERVPYESVDHEPEYTAQRVAEAAHISGRLMAKIVLVKIDGELAMVVVPAASRIDLNRLEQELGARHVELAREGEFERLFPDSEPGAEPPFGNLYGLPVFVSERLANNAQIAFNAGTHSQVIRMHYRDFERLVKPHLVSSWVAAGGLKAGRG